MLKGIRKVLTTAVSVAAAFLFVNPIQILIASPTTIAVDGNLSDWAGIKPVWSANNGYIREMKIIRDNTYMYIAMKGQNLNSSSRYEVMLNTDNNSSTGRQMPGWTTSGIEYQIEDGILYATSGTSSTSSWRYIRRVESSANTDTTIELKVRLTDIKPQRIIQVRAALVNSDWEVIERVPRTWEMINVGGDITITPKPTRVPTRTPTRVPTRIPTAAPTRIPVPTPIISPVGINDVIAKGAKGDGVSDDSAYFSTTLDNYIQKGRTVALSISKFNSIKSNFTGEGKIKILGMPWYVQPSHPQGVVSPKDMDDEILMDMNLPNEAKPYGSNVVQAISGWYPFNDISMPSNYTSMDSWGQIFIKEGASYPKQSYVYIKNLTLVVYRNSTHRWEVLNKATKIGGAWFDSDYSDNGTIPSLPAAVTDIPNGIKVRMDDNVGRRCFHFYPLAGNRFTPVPSDIKFAVAYFDVYTDSDEADNVFVANAGAAYKGNGGSLTHEAMGGRFKNVTKFPRRVYATNLDYNNYFTYANQSLIDNLANSGSVITPTPKPTVTPTRIPTPVPTKIPVPTPTAVPTSSVGSNDVIAKGAKGDGVSDDSAYFSTTQDNYIQAGKICALTIDKFNSIHTTFRGDGRIKILGVPRWSAPSHPQGTVYVKDMNDKILMSMNLPNEAHPYGANPVQYVSGWYSRDKVSLESWVSRLNPWGQIFLKEGSSWPTGSHVYIENFTTAFYSKSHQKWEILVKNPEIAGMWYDSDYSDNGTIPNISATYAPITNGAKLNIDDASRIGRRCFHFYPNNNNAYRISSVWDGTRIHPEDIQWIVSYFDVYTDAPDNTLLANVGTDTWSDNWQIQEIGGGNFINITKNKRRVYITSLDYNNYFAYCNQGLIDSLK